MDFRAQSDSNRQISLNWTAINAYTARYKPDTWFDISITRKVSKTSDPQRRYYFSTVVATYAEKLGYQVTEYYLFHTFLKFRFFEGYYKGRGEPEKAPYLDKHNIMQNVPALFSNDSEFDVKVKTQFIDWVIMRASTVDGVYIPDPGEES